MKYVEILEKSISTKTSTIQQSSNNRTIGFEIEINYESSHGASSEMREHLKQQIMEDNPINEFFKDNYFYGPKESYLSEFSMFSVNFEEFADFEYAPKYKVIEYFEEEQPKAYRLSKELIKRYKNIKNDLIDNKKDFLIDLLNARSKIFSDITFKEYKYRMMDSIYNDDLSEKFLNKHIENNIKSLADYTLHGLDDNEKTEKYILRENDSYEDGYEVVPISDIDYHDLEDDILNNPDEVKERIERDYNIFIEEEVNIRLEDEDEKEIDLNEITEVISNELDVDVDVGSTPRRGSDTWIVDTDQSVPSGFELKSPIFEDINEGIKHLENVLNMIKVNENMSTDEYTGLHINIGNIDLNNFDFLKFLLFIGEENILDEFNRKGNKFTVSLLEYLYTYLSGYNNDGNKTYSEVISDINSKLISYAMEKFKFISIRNLFSNNYMEIRGIGGSNYEDKKNKIIKFVRTIAHRIDVAENPKIYREEYLKKIYEILQESDEQKLDISAEAPLNKEQTNRLANYFNQNGVKDFFSSSFAQNKISSMKENRNELIRRITQLLDSISSMEGNNIKIPNDIIRILSLLYKNGKEIAYSNSDPRLMLKENWVRNLHEYADKTNSKGIMNLLNKYVFPDLEKEKENQK